MSIKLSGQVHLPASPEVVWGLLMDEATLAACIPGCESLQATDSTHWNATIELGIGAFKGRYSGTVAIEDQDPMEAFTLSGSGGGAPGFLNGTARVSLLPDPNGTTVLWDAQGEVGGRIAAVGQRAIVGVAKFLIARFFNCMRGRLSASNSGNVAVDA